MKVAVAMEQVQTVEMSVSEVMSRMETELRSLAMAADQLQGAIAPILAEELSKQAQSSDALQSLDTVAQTLRALAEFSNALSSTIPDTWTVDTNAATSDLLLEELAQRLSDVEHQYAGRRVASGECDFF